MGTDTIAAPATPPGRGGIAIVRVSGPLVKQVMGAVLGQDLLPRQASYLPFRDATQALIDEGIAVFFPGPHSFTGEDVLELQGHGGPILVDQLLQHMLSIGVRLARPGEFSLRAFLNGKIDLAQAEAIADLINASSIQAARSALRSLQGVFSKEIHALNEKIIHLRMYVEAAIDFTDEEIDWLSDEKTIAALKTILTDLSAIQMKAKQGHFLSEGITAVIVGEPNVGKSSLLNCLSGKELAIVTDIPGTTRDILRDHIHIDGMPVHIIDTAGLRDSEDVIEQEGIRRAYREMEQADIILYMTEASKPIHVAKNTQPMILIRNKIDLINQNPSLQVEEGKTIISLSAKLGLGIDLLKKQIKTVVGFAGEEDGFFLARRRHLDALAKALSYLENGFKELSQARRGELVAEDLRLAQHALSEITGEFTADDLLGRIFSSFCVGK